VFAALLAILVPGLIAGGTASAQQVPPPDKPFAEHRIVLQLSGEEVIGADTTIGQVVRLDNEPHEIIGVASPLLDVPNSPDFFVPLRINRKTPTQG